MFVTPKGNERAALLTEPEAMGLFPKGLQHDDINGEFSRLYRERISESWTIIKLIELVLTIDDEMGTDAEALADGEYGLCF